METQEVEELQDFMDEMPTGRCGEGGCNACDLAFHRSCDPITRPRAEAYIEIFPEEEATDPDIRTIFIEDQEYAELGGEG